MKYVIHLVGGWVCLYKNMLSIHIYIDFSHNIALEYKKVYNVYVYCISLSYN